MCIVLYLPWESKTIRKVTQKTCTRHVLCTSVGLSFCLCITGETLYIAANQRGAVARPIHGVVPGPRIGMAKPLFRSQVAPPFVVCLFFYLQLHALSSSPGMVGALFFSWVFFSHLPHLRRPSPPASPKRDRAGRFRAAARWATTIPAVGS